MLNATLGAAVRELGPNFALELSNQLQNGSGYLWQQFLPEEQRASYYVDGGTITVSSTMAGLAGMDSPYAPGGRMSITKFLESTAKIANTVRLPEQLLRQLQDMVARAQFAASLNGTSSTALTTLIEELLNFTEKAIIQPHLDTMEWLRSQALTAGKIDWQFNKQKLLIDYGVPTSNFITKATGASGYGNPSSTFWADDRKAQRALRYKLAARVMHAETYDALVNQPANNIEVVTFSDSPDGTRRAQLRKYVNRAGNTVASSDARDTVDVIIYDREGEMLNPADPSGETLKVPFMPIGKIVYIGQGGDNGYRVGQGATPDADNSRRLGYTHIGPTVENNGAVGRWVSVIQPEREEWIIEGRGVTNGLPVIESEKKIAILETEMPA